ncbi:MAG: sigma-70 family RNA polymerase sigma factor [Elusimicrobia bacterium]|nr:sigma-70 family RNA polymerase sigma factor [Elusimicrobiota bacterium]
MSNQPDENEFLARNAALVYNLSLRLVGNPTDAEDLAQDALLRALKALPGFRGDSSLSTWVYRITVNTWKNRVRSEKRRGFWKTVSLNLFTGEDADEEPSFKADDPPLDAGLETGEKGTMVQKGLMELDEESRAVIVLRDIEERSYQEIAAILRIPEGTVKSRLSRARESLRNKLKGRLAVP